MGIAMLFENMKKIKEISKKYLQNPKLYGSIHLVAEVHTEAQNKYGVLAQLGEHLPYKQRVIGSSPIGPIYLAR